MKKVIYFIFTIVLLTACVDNLDDYNVDQKRASTAPPKTLFTASVKALTDWITTPSVNFNNFRLFVQYWTTTTYLNEPRYNMIARTYSQNIWTVLYRDVLSDLKEAKRLIEDDELLDATQKNNQLAQIGIIEVYTWHILVTTFGNVPYSEALDFNKPLPKYDDAATIYADLLKRLDASLQLLTPGTSSGFGANDIFYGGNADKWIKFGNSIKLKMGMLLIDVDPAKAEAIVEQAAPFVVTTNEDNAIFKYVASPNNNPISANVNPLFTSREDFIVASTIVDVMNTLEDPRRPFYFTTVDGEYIGGKYGFPNAYANYSHASDKITAPTFEAIFLDAAEIRFLLAEAVERGFSVGGTAEEHYNAGITNSITYWGGSMGDAQIYLAQDDVSYLTAEGDYIEKIGLQKWLALNNRGWESWVEWRRIDKPTLIPPSGEGIVNPLKIPVRMIYPVSEQTQNGAQRAAAASAIGGDEANTKLFWDKK
jgi:hypothetical protein